MSKRDPSDKNGLHTGSSVGTRASAPASESSRNAEIARLAYAKAEARGFTPGHEMDDWLEAEAEVDGEFDAGYEPPRPPRHAASRGTSHPR